MTEVPAARAIKLEDPPTPLKTVRILEQTKGIEVGILGGLGGGFLLEELMAGASGAMTGFAYPEMLIEVVKLSTGATLPVVVSVLNRACFRFTSPSSRLHAVP